jgi:alpha-galactosidase
MTTEHTMGGTIVRYIDIGGVISLQMIPSDLRADAVLLPEDTDYATVYADSLAQVKVLGDAYCGGFGQGHTMRQSDSVRRFSMDSQERAGDSVVTVLRSVEGHAIEHRLTHLPGPDVFRIDVVFRNGADAPVTLEMLGSFSLAGITPFDKVDGSGRLVAHRFRSVWSAEGRHEARTLEDLHLERSWSSAGMFSERFGQVGTMPVRRWFPFAAIEDTRAGVLWGAQLAWAGSWQMEIVRQHFQVSLSGGLADREFGHWMKTLAPGESLAAPSATVACVHGTFDELCDRLTRSQESAIGLQPSVEQDLPVVFNEWCTTWGDPRHDKVLRIADRLEGTGVRYLVIDAGWYKSDGTEWGLSHGDWIPNRGLFPEGLEGVAEAIRRRGLVPGLWFEMETCGRDSMAFSLVDHLLRRDGIPVTVGARRFWDMNDPWVIDYLSDRVIDVMERCGFGYLKVDYNETLGIGCDHPDSFGEGLRRQVLGTYRFFEKIRARLPDLVIENCASGGHRLEPSMLALTAMSSFSDAHEAVEIPVIAAGLHRLILPRQSQIWAVLRAGHTNQRLAYSLAATFLGRMCLSGEIGELSAAQWEIATRAMALYGKAATIIKHGTSRHFGESGTSWRHPTGWQAVRRSARDGNRILVVLHTFAGAASEVEIPLPPGTWSIESAFPESPAECGGALRVRELADFEGKVFLLEKYADGVDPSKSIVRPDARV